MNKKIIKAVVLTLVFLASLVGFSMLTRTEQTSLISDMPEATLPVIYLEHNGDYVNELFGYKEEMNGTAVRDNITPLAENLVLPVTVEAYDNHVESISYEVRTMDMERLLENTQVSNFTQKEGKISTEFQIQNLLDKEQEYMLTIFLECGGEEIRYYTRIICAPQWYVEESLDFAMNFHEITFAPERASEIAMYMEPNSEGDNTTLQKVTIHSSMNQVTWADFEGEVLKAPIPSIKEIGKFAHTIVLNYVLAANGENGETEFYNVEEYYRLRYSTINNRMYLLDYERTMNEIFRGSGDNLIKTGLRLGIRDENVSYMTNENDTIVSFVQEGDLWSYNSNTNRLSLVYSFRGIEGINNRSNNQEHDIRIIKIDESGSVDFVVYGYMNRGTYEGHTGIGVYHYDSMANTIEEVLFVQSDAPYQVLKEVWGQLFYVSQQGYFYMLAEEDLYRIPLATGEPQILQRSLKEGEYAVSEDGRYVAFKDSQQENIITVTDLEGEKQWQATGHSLENLKPIGFVESDFVYGISRPQDMAVTGELLYKIEIMDKEQQIIKEYEKSGYYITDAYVEDSTVFLERAWLEGGIYRPIEPDAIKSHEIAAAKKVQVETIQGQVKQTEVVLGFGREMMEKAPQVLTPKEILKEEKYVVALDTVPQQELYYVYARGKVITGTTHLDEAIQTADEWAGVVTGAGQQYWWRRGRDSSLSLANAVILEDEMLLSTSGSMERCLLALLKKEGITFDVGGLLNAGEGPGTILKEAIPDAQVFNLTGLSVAQVLYYINQKSPVLALGENQEPVLLVGYDERNLTLYDPQTNSTRRMGLSDSEEFFQEAGSVFISYLRQ